ncbi:YcgN family cysteine cluster protein [Kaistia granuli]|uniref:YcgN family cysteine cluster protein n=1 Tax=Kaistia granuli TaxID=363259 RepID=UPI000381D2E3|nr:YcgN family cysteine cluster protein [Kaistia granuli]
MPLQGKDARQAAPSAQQDAAPTTGALPVPQDADTLPFWKRLTLEEMNSEQWESLCDGCARCCLNKLEDWDTGEIVWTAIACELLDDDTCRCKDYPNRHDFVPDCIPLDPATVRTLTWLPPTCGYRLIAEGHDLYWWHPLVSGDPETVHEAGISTSGRTVSESDIPVEEYEDYIIAWPGELVEPEPPKG